MNEVMKKTNYLVSNSIHRLFRKLPRKTIDELNRNLRKRSIQKGLTYVNDEGKTVLIDLTLRPRLIDRKKRDALWRTLKILDAAYSKIPQLYLNDPAARELFPFSCRELEWMSLLKSPNYIRGQSATRWDANTTFGENDWKDGFSFFEVNGVGVGGLWYGPACAELALETVVPELQKLDPAFRPRLLHDMKRLILDLLIAQRRKLKRTSGAIALTMERASGSNFVEFERLKTFFRAWSHETIVTEPVDFRLENGEIFARGRKIDIIYRDTTLAELCALEEKGRDLSAFKEAFRRGQVVSSLEGEFDHKSAFEVFTDPRYANRFTRKERNTLKQFILWTRLVREIKTTDPNGKPADLIPFVLGHQETLVLKPNRLYGGKGIVFGRDMTRKSWGEKIETALIERGEWVVQQLGKLKKKRFYRPDGKKVCERDLYVVSGFFATDKGLGIVGRMSEHAIVNVAQRGGLTPILLI